MSAEILKEFLVEVGWRSDQAQERRFFDGIAAATKSIVALGATIKTVEVAVIGMAQRISSGFEQLAYASSRVNASVANISSFRYAISQLGGTAEGAMQALEAFGRKLRESPGEEARLRAYGVKTRDAQGRLRDTTELIKEMTRTQKFRTLPYFSQLQIAESMGIDERTFRALLGDVDRFTREYRQKLNAAGLDPDKAAENGKKIATAWRSMTASIEMLVDRIMLKHGDTITKHIKDFSDWLDAHGDEIADTLERLIKALLDAGKYVADLVGKFLDFISKADPFVEKVTGMKSALSALAAVILLNLIPGVGALTTALLGLVTGAGWRGLMAGLGMLGIGGGAAAMGGAALGFGLGMTPGGTNESIPEQQRQQIEKANPGSLKGDGDVGFWGRVKRFFGIGGAKARETVEGQPGGATPHGSAAMGDAMGYAMDQLRKEGVPESNLRAAAAHLVGQAWMESSLNPNATHDSGTGFGIYGARDPIGPGRKRRTEMLRWLAENGYANNSLEGQMRYMAHEAMSKYPRTRGILMGATEGGLANESWGVTRDFEAPLITNDRSSAVVRAYRAGQAAGMRKQVSSALSDEAVAAARRNSFADRINHGGSIADPIPAAAAPGTHNSFVNSIAHGHTLHAKTSITVNAASDPGATAREVANQQNRVNAETIRNLNGAAR